MSLWEKLQKELTLIRVHEIHMGQGLSKCPNYRRVQLRLTSYCVCIRGSIGWSVSLVYSLATSETEPYFWMFIMLLMRADTLEFSKR